MNQYELTKEKRILVRLLQSALWNAALPQISPDLDFSAIFTEADKQSVLCLLFPLLSRLDTTDKWKEKWVFRQYRLIQHNTNISSAEDRLISLFHTNHVNFLIIKGSSCARYYPFPLLRTRGDVDIVVKADALKEISQLLLHNGYQLEDDSLERHMEFKKDGIAFELHPHTYDLPELLSAALLQAQKTLDPYPDDAATGIIILNHIKYHLFHLGIGVRHLMDWIVFADKICTDSFWNNMLAPLAEKYELTQLAKCLTLIGKRYFQVCADCTWCDDVDSADADMLLYAFFHAGNFSSKYTSSRRRFIHLFSTRRDLQTFIDTIDYDVTNRHENKSHSSYGRISQLLNYGVSYVKDNGIHPVQMYQDIRYAKKLNGLLYSFDK